ncbi:MAG: hypothetical protein ACYCO5_16865 [Acidobacteriaceae bacterium]
MAAAFLGSTFISIEMVGLRILYAFCTINSKLADLAPWAAARRITSATTEGFFFAWSSFV